jgi:hypothetical protein
LSANPRACYEGFGAEGEIMSISFVHSKGADAPITIPAIGLELMVRMAPAATGDAFSIIETQRAGEKAAAT